MFWINTRQWSVAAVVFTGMPLLAQPAPKPAPAAEVAPKAATVPRPAEGFDWDFKPGDHFNLNFDRVEQAMKDLKFDMAFDSTPMSNAITLMAFQPMPRPAKLARRPDEAYQRGMSALDQKRWEDALNFFQQAAGEGASRADAALYWSAYSHNKLGHRNEALASLDALRKQYPQSGWINDAKALEVEVRQASGRPVSPDQVDDDDVKLMALNGLMHSSPERALPIIEKMLTGSQSPKVKERALFVLSQSDEARAREILVKIARGGANPDLQRTAVRNLAVRGGANNQLLTEIYASQSDPAVRREVLRGLMISGDTARLAAVAKSEKDPSLRREAIRLIGAARDTKALSELLAGESDPSVRNEIVGSFMAAGDFTKLIEIANNDRDMAIRRRAVQMLGAMGPDNAGEALVQIYRKSQDVELKKTVIRSFVSQRNATRLVEIARQETNPELKREAVRVLSHMESKEAADFMLELLEK